MERTVTTVGTGTATAVPDAVSLHVQARHRAESVSDAMAGCASAVESLVRTAAEVTSREHVRTTGFHLGRHHDRGGRPVGFEASHEIAVLCSDFDAAGDLLTVLADELGERFSVHDVRPTLTATAGYQRQARERAFADARAKAEELAALAGQRLLGVLRVVEGNQDQPYGHPPGMVMLSAETRFEPGTTDVTATVTVTWETEPV